MGWSPTEPLLLVENLGSNLWREPFRKWWCPCNDHFRAERTTPSPMLGRICCIQQMDWWFQLDPNWIPIDDGFNQAVPLWPWQWSISNFNGFSKQDQASTNWQMLNYVVCDCKGVHNQIFRNHFWKVGASSTGSMSHLRIWCYYQSKSAVHVYSLYGSTWLTPKVDALEEKIDQICFPFNALLGGLLPVISGYISA